MKARNGNRFFFWAVAVSLVLHGALAIVVRTLPAVRAADEQRPDRVQIVHVATPPPPVPTPTPRPAPVHPPVAVARAAARPHPRVAAPHVGGGHSPSGPVEPAVPAGTGDPAGAGDDVAASPLPSPKPACAQPNVPARTLQAVAANVPDDAEGINATAQIAVTLDALGRVTGATVYQSTNDLRLDREALRAAKASTYAPAIADCLPTGGTYLFRVDFQD